MNTSETQLQLLNAPNDALFVCNHSGGKDSQAMFKWMYDNLDHKRLIVVHAHLVGADWEGTIEHIHKTTENIPVHIVSANKTFLEMVRHRQMWPSPVNRNCTSDLKTSPIAKFIRNFAKTHNYTTIYNCMGLRAEESSNRSKIEPFQINKKLTIKSRTVYNVLPIHHYTVKQVFQSYNISLQELNHRRKLYNQGFKDIALKQWPFIYTYVAGMSRHSCKLCIMSKRSDLICSSKLDPTHFQSYLDVEKEIDHQFLMPSKSSPSLSQILTLQTHQQETLKF